MSCLVAFARKSYSAMAFVLIAVPSAAFEQTDEIQVYDAKRNLTLSTLHEGRAPLARSSVAGAGSTLRE